MYSIYYKFPTHGFWEYTDWMSLDDAKEQLFYYASSGASVKLIKRG